MVPSAARKRNHCIAQLGSSQSPLKGEEATVEAPVGRPGRRPKCDDRRQGNREAPPSGDGVLPGVPPSPPVAARASPVSSARRSPAAAAAAEEDEAAPADPDARRPRRCRGTRSHPSATPATNSPNSSIAAQRRRGGRPKARPGAAAGGALTGAAGHSLAASCPGPRRLGSGLPPGANPLPSPAARGARLPAAFIGSGYLKKKKKKWGSAVVRRLPTRRDTRAAAAATPGSAALARPSPSPAPAPPPRRIPPPPPARARRSTTLGRDTSLPSHTSSHTNPPPPSAPPQRRRVEVVLRVRGHRPLPGGVPRLVGGVRDMHPGYASGSKEPEREEGVCVSPTL